MTIFIMLVVWSVCSRLRVLAWTNSKSTTSALQNCDHLQRTFLPYQISCRPTSSLRQATSKSSDDFSAEAATNTDAGRSENTEPPQPLYLEEGLFAVVKPLGWTSQQVVGKVRKILEQDAKARNVPDQRTKRRRPWMKVGHGGTLDPLATGVLVIGVGKGTKQLQRYLTGAKGYRATVELGYQTTTLDLEGEIVTEKDYDHVTQDLVAQRVADFQGTIQQTPPIFSALKVDGERLYKLGRKGKTEDDVKIEPRTVQIHAIEPIWEDDSPKKFGLDVHCGGGTYIRSLVRDIGISLDTVATMTSLERTQQGAFLLEHCVKEEADDWTVEKIVNAIQSGRNVLEAYEIEKSNDHDDEQQ